MYGDISRFLFHLLVSIVLGIAAGASAVIFHLALEAMKDFFAPGKTSGGEIPYLIVLIPLPGPSLPPLLPDHFENFPVKLEYSVSLRPCF